MYGYKHAYYVNIGTEYDLQRSSVTDFAIIPQSPKFEEFYDWSIGDIIQSKSGAAHEIIFRSGEFMARKPLHEDGEEYVICSTCKELYDGGWRLFEPPKNMSIEVTTEDIRKALNIPDGSRIIITK
jgi:hypothetical protein